MKIKLILLVFFFCVFLPLRVLAQGGPPLITDDPGTPGDGHWEINIAEQSETTGTGSVTPAYFASNIFPAIRLNSASYEWCGGECRTSRSFN